MLVCMHIDSDPPCLQGQVDDVTVSMGGQLELKLAKPLSLHM